MSIDSGLAKDFFDHKGTKARREISCSATLRFCGSKNCVASPDQLALLGLYLPKFLGNNPPFERLALGISLPPDKRELMVSTAGQPDFRLQLKLLPVPNRQNKHSSRNAVLDLKAKDFPDFDIISPVFCVNDSITNESPCKI